MASMLVPTTRRVAAALSGSTHLQTNEDLLNELLSANPTAGVQIADEEQALDIAQNHPSICFGNAHGGRVRVCWGFSKLHRLGHPLDGRTLCIEGDVTNYGAINVTHIDESNFALAPSVLVHSVDDIIAHFEASPNATYLDPPAGTRSQTLSLRYRKTFRVPHVAAAPLMEYAEGVTPREYFTVIYPTLDTAGKKEAWKMVTEQFQVLAMAETPGGIKSVAELDHPPPVVRMDDFVERVMNAKLFELLPERRDNGTAAGLQNLNSTLATGFTSMQAHNEAQRDAQMALQQQKEEEKKKKKTLEGKLGQLLAKRILRALQISREADIPDGLVWPLWCTSTESKSPESFRQALAETVTEMARKAGELEAVPDITLAMATGIMQGKFGKVSLDDPGTGWFCNFLLYGKVPADFTKAQIEKSRAGESSNVTLTPNEASELLKFRTFLPATHEASRNVHRMLMVARAVFPMGHPFINHLKDIESQWSNHHDVIDNCVLANTALDASKGIILLETFSIKINRYWSEINAGSNPTFPPPSRLFTQMKDRESWIPHLTPAYMECLGLKHFTGVRNDFWLENMLGGGGCAVRRAVEEIGARAAEGVTAISGNNPRAGGTPPGGIGQLGTNTSKGTNTSIKNDEYNDVLFDEFRRRKLNGKEIPIRYFKDDAVKNVPLPKSKFGAASMCLAWHVKGMCNSKCGLASDHSSYSAAEYAPLVSWCQTCYPAGE